MALPPLAAIEALDRLAHHGSARDAAAALSITPSALSHRLRGLEATLGRPVVTAAGRGVRLTAEGRRFLDAARPALDALRAAMVEAPAEAGGALSVAAAPGFAAAWLCPRLEEARAAMPGLRLSLRPDTDAGPEPDISILFVAPDRAPPNARRLLQPDFFPVCAPALANAAGGLRRPAALAGQVLLHLYDDEDWRRWFAAAHAPPGLAEDAAREGRAATFGDANLLLAAALAGQGVALGDPITCAGYLASGALVRPTPECAPSARAYFLLISPSAPPLARRFAGWLEDRLPRA